MAAAAALDSDSLRLQPPPLLPTLDSPDAGITLLDSLRQRGCWTFALPASDAALLAEARAAQSALFNSDAASKRSVAIAPGCDVGYKRVAGVHEAFHIRECAASTVVSLAWPRWSSVERFEEIMRATFRLLSAQVRRALQLLAVALGGPASTFDALLEHDSDLESTEEEEEEAEPSSRTLGSFSVSSDLLNLYRYALQPSPSRSAAACPAHTDVGLISLILIADVEGLQCAARPIGTATAALSAHHTRDAYVDVERLPASLPPAWRARAVTLIVGETLAHLVGHAAGLTPTIHRVVARDCGAQRESLVFKCRGRVGATLDVERTMRALRDVWTADLAMRRERGWEAPRAFPPPCTLAEFLEQHIRSAPFSVNFPGDAAKLNYAKCILDPSRNVT